MGEKNKTVSFRVSEETFNRLRDIAEERDVSLSSVFRDYVDSFIEHNGNVKIVPRNQAEEDEFPPLVEVPTEMVREHERLELENEHLREQVEEYEAYINRLQNGEDPDSEEVIILEDLDEDVESRQF